MSDRLLRLPHLALLFLVGVLVAMTPPGAARADESAVGEWPLRPRPQVVARFDPPVDPWGRGHRGVDLLGQVGQPVRAALPGRVAFVGTIAGRGVVTVDHGATRTTYEPVTAGVQVGDSVGAGSPLGRLELSGSHCFPRACLHWGWLRGEVYLDPLLLVGEVEIRLLPWAGQASSSPPTPLSRGAQPLGPRMGLLIGPP